MGEIYVLEDLLNTLIQLEVKGFELYEEYKNNAEDPNLKQLFGELAAAEKNHEIFYKSVKEKVLSSDMNCLAHGPARPPRRPPCANPGSRPGPCWPTRAWGLPGRARDVMASAKGTGEAQRPAQILRAGRLSVLGCALFTLAPSYSSSCSGLARPASPALHQLPAIWSIWATFSSASSSSLIAGRKVSATCQRNWSAAGYCSR